MMSEIFQNLCTAEQCDSLEAEEAAAGLDEGLLSFSRSDLLYMENPYSYKKFQ